jgi:signal transduction histidine kinase
MSPKNTERLRGRVKRLEALLDGLLDYSRVRRSDVKITRVNSQQLCEEIGDYLAMPDGISLHLAEDLPTFSTASKALETVLRNLVGNAVKHHDRETGRIDVSAQDCGDTYQFTVRDDGPGIDTAHHERVFQLFQTLVPRNKMESSGLGLSIVKRLVIAAGGKIWIESIADQPGAAFHFTWNKTWFNA